MSELGWYDIEADGVMQAREHSKQYPPALDSRMRKCINLISQQTGITLLDVGCHFSPIKPLLPNRWNVDGVDIVGGHEFKRNLNKDWKINKKYDVIFAGEVIEHMIDPPHFIRECWKHLKPNGTLILTTPNLNSIHNRIKVLFGRQPKFLDLWTHHFIYSTSFLKKLVEDNGFNVVHITSTGLFFTSPKWNNILQYIGRFSGNILPSLGHITIMEAVKCVK